MYPTVASRSVYRYNTEEAISDNTPDELTVAIEGGVRLNSVNRTRKQMCRQ